MGGRGLWPASEGFGRAPLALVAGTDRCPLCPAGCPGPCERAVPLPVQRDRAERDPHGQAPGSPRGTGAEAQPQEPPEEKKEEKRKRRRTPRHQLCLCTWEPGESANAVPHYHKLCSRVSRIWGNRRGQHTRSAGDEPRPGKTTCLIMVSPLPGKYAPTSPTTRPHHSARTPSTRTPAPKAPPGPSPRPLPAPSSGPVPSPLRAHGGLQGGAAWRGLGPGMRRGA